MSNEDRFREQVLTALEQALVDYSDALEHMKSVHDRYHDLTDVLRDEEIIKELSSDRVPRVLLEAAIIPCLIHHLVLPHIEQRLRELSVGILATKNHEIAWGVRPPDAEVIGQFLDALAGDPPKPKKLGNVFDAFGDLSKFDFDSFLRRNNCEDN